MLKALVYIFSAAFILSSIFIPYANEYPLYFKSITMMLCVYTLYALTGNSKLSQRALAFDSYLFPKLIALFVLVVFNPLSDFTLGSYAEIAVKTAAGLFFLTLCAVEITRMIRFREIKN